jgi:hypothetical protein
MAYSRKPTGRRRTADHPARWEDRILDFLALGLSWRLSVFGRDANGAYRRIPRRHLLNGRFAGGGKKLIVDDEGVVFTDLKIRKAELVDLCNVSPVLDRRRRPAPLLRSHA